MVGFGLGRVRVLFGFAFGLICSRSHKGHDLLEGLSPFTATRATICWRGFGFGLVWLALGLVGFGLGLLPVGFGFVWVCFGFDWVGFGLG